MAYENKIAMEGSLKRALTRIFGEGASLERVAAESAAAATGAAARPLAAQGDLGV